MTWPCRSGGQGAQRAGGHEERRQHAAHRPHQHHQLALQHQGRDPRRRQPPGTVNGLAACLIGVGIYILPILPLLELQFTVHMIFCIYKTSLP